MKVFSFGYDYLDYRTSHLQRYVEQNDTSMPPNLHSWCEIAGAIGTA